MKKLIITGNVGQDPEVRVDGSGEAYTTFAVGVSVGTKQQPKTDWIDISCSGRTAEVVNNYVRRGTKVLVEGFPTTKAYINKENQPTSVMRLYAHSLELLSKRENSDENSEVYHLPESNQSSSVKMESEIPF